MKKEVDAEIFFIRLRGLSVARNRLRPGSGLLRIANSQLKNSHSCPSFKKSYILKFKERVLR